MQGAGDHVLADAEFAFEHDRAVVVRHTANNVKNALDGLAVADELRGADATQDAGRCGCGTRDARRPGGAAFALERLIDGLDEVAEVEGLREVIESPEAHGLDGGFDAAVAGDHDHRGVRELVPAHADEIEAIHVPDAQIGDDEVRLVRANGRDAIDAGRAAHHLMASGLAELGHELEDRGFVVYDY